MRGHGRCGTEGAPLDNNVVYTAPVSELGALPEAFRGAPEVPDEYEVAQRSFHVGLAREGRVTNLQLSITQEELELSINVHTELRNRDSDAAQVAARRFLQDRRDGESLICQLFRAKVEHGNGNGKPA